MKIESNICNNTFWLTLWSVIAVCVCTLIGYVAYSYNDRAKTAFEKGYVEDTVAGSNLIVWTKK